MDYPCKSILRKALESRDCPNIILYGASGVGKKYLLKQLLQCQSSKKIEHTDNHDYSVLYTDQYCEFNIDHINRNNIEHFFKTIHEYVKTRYNYCPNVIRRIILKNFQKTKVIIQNRLRVIIEKYRASTVFILITNRFTSVIDPIRSRCLCIRVPALKNPVKREIVRSIVPFQQRSSELYDTIYPLNNSSDIRIISLCTDIHLLKNYKDPILITCLKVYEILTKDTLLSDDIDKLREISYSIAKYNLPINELYQELLGIFLGDQKYTIQQKHKLVQLFAKYEHLYIQSYRLLIHIETLFIQIQNLLAFGNNEIYDEEEEEVHIFLSAARPYENKEEESSHENIAHNSMDRCE